MRSPTVIHLVRHGTTNWNLAGRLQGRTDIPLNDQGRLEAASAAAALQGEEYAALYTSPLQRARQTASIIAEQVKLPVHVEDGLIERAYGEWEGRRLTGRARIADEASAGVEPAQSLRERAINCLTQLARRHFGQRLIVVSHGAWINALLYVLSDGRAGTGITNLANGGITTLTSQSIDLWQVTRLNDVRHLTNPHGQTDRRSSR